MKTKVLLFVATFAILATFSCKKEESKEITYGASISPVENVVNNLGTIYYFRDEPTTFGIKFKSSKDGRITHLGIRSGSGTYTIALWDSSAQSVITATSIKVTDSTVFAYKDILDIDILANKVYIISMGNQISEGGSGANAYKNLSVDYRFPFTQGDITLLSSCYKFTNNALTLFPISTEATGIIYGFADIKFEPKK
ncbi:MAG: DUF4082 domain-containing protein [Sphingobacteriales bacterium]|nr:MAG: DUF4082 domain-containing protein [Sphingobacteriales bacterium]